jgi:PKD repeat protein
MNFEKKPIWKSALSVFTILMILTLLSAGASAKRTYSEDDYTADDYTEDESNLKIYKTPLGAGTPPATQHLNCCDNTRIAYTAVAASEDDPRVIKFIDKSNNGGEYIQWEFGDGEYSSAGNPVHKFPKKGYYISGLTIKCDDCGKKLWVHKTLIIK